MVNHPIDEQDVRRSYATRLQTLCKAWNTKWAAAHEHSQRLVRLWASGYYDAGYGRWHLVNLMDRGVSSLTSFLVEGNPRVMVEPLSPKLRDFAYYMKLILNFAIEQNNFADEVLIPGAVASMFGDTIARTFYEYDRAVSIDGEKIKIGTPRVALIEPCDYIGDPSVKVRRDFAIEGDVYRLSTEYAKDLFAGKDKHGHQIADYIDSDCKLVTKYSAEEAIAPSFDHNKLALEDFSTFIDVYNKREGVIDTIMPMGHTAKILKTVEWTGEKTGPSGGPYDVLGYRYLPNIPVSLPPAFAWYDMDVTMNIVAKAAREQAESQKTVIGAEPIAKDAAQAVLSAKNLDVFLARNLDKVKQFSFGGVDAANWQWLQWAEGEFTRSGMASSDVLGGRGAQAGTLGQEQMVYANATRVVNNFYNRFHQWETSILRKWAHALMNDPAAYFEVLGTIDIPGLGKFDYPVVYSQADKVGEFQDLVLKVVPYSSQRRTPEKRFSDLMQFLTSWLLPTMSLRQAQGASIDFEAADRLLADYGGIDEFPQFYRGVVPNAGVDVDFVMQTPQSVSSSGQTDDRFGSTPASRDANLRQQQMRVGYGAEAGKGTTNAE